MLRIAHYFLWIALGLAETVGPASPAVSKPPPAEEWQASHIEALPGEVSREVRKWQKSCGALKARSSFSGTVEIAGRRYLALHFEQLHCEDRTAICSPSGCLHEVYEFRHGRFQKVTSLQTSELQITVSGNQAVLEVDCGLLGCLRTLRWDGKGFTEKEKPSIDTEHIFGFTEGADIGRKGEIELESTFTGRFGNIGHYGAFDNETAARYIFADGLRASLGLLSDFHQVSGVAGLRDTTALNFNGISGELRWQLLESSKAPIGLTLSFNPQWLRVDDFTGQLAGTYAVPMILLIDTAVVPDRLFAAMNVTYAPSIERIIGLWERESGLEVSAAISGVMAPGVLLGAEVRHLSAFEGLFLNREDGHALYIGPSLFLKLPNGIVAKFVWSARASGAGERFERNQVRAQFVKSF
jgi:hypothetical protein